MKINWNFLTKNCFSKMYMFIKGWGTDIMSYNIKIWLTIALLKDSFLKSVFELLDSKLPNSSTFGRPYKIFFK